MSISEVLAISQTVTVTTDATTDPAITVGTNIPLTLPKVSVTRNGSSTPPVTKVAEGKITLTNGTTAVDLTACAGPNGAVNGNTLAVRSVVIQTQANNVGTCTVKASTSSGYPIFGATGVVVFEAAVPQIQTAAKDFGAGGAAIGSGCKNIDFVGTNAGDIVYYKIVMG